MDGGNNNDILYAGNGADTLIGMAGNESLYGQAGDDQFNFAAGGDDDVITAFSAGAASDDVILISGYGSTFDSFSEVLAAASDNGVDTVIDFGGGDSITLVGVLVSQLHADDFAFL